MAISLSEDEKAQLERENSLIRDLPGASGSDQASYYNPVTGQEISAPTDPYHLTRRIKQGWRLGPAPIELKGKWLIREQELKEEDDRRQEEFENSDEHKVDLQSQADQFTDAVATAVTKVLEGMGIDPNERGQAHPQTEEEAAKITTTESREDPTVVETNMPLQLDLFAPTDASSESETKHEVSPASRPELHLVE